MINLETFDCHRPKNHQSRYLCQGLDPVAVDLGHLVVVTAEVVVDLGQLVVGTVEVVPVHIEAEAEVVVREADPVHIPDQDQEAWIVVETEDHVAEEVMTVERITSQDLDLVMGEAVDVEDIAISEIVTSAIIVDGEETEDGLAMEVAVAVLVVAVSEVVNEDSIGVQEVDRTTVLIVSAVLLIAIRVPLTMTKARTTENLHHQQVRTLKALTRKVKSTFHKMAEAERIKVWKKLKR